ncbi:beta-mannosidase [Jannaschia marina]|uniref:beta-mannosidase n=1 Tax=Jannaschia marina TaxID=2741674 RepID=UPI0015CBDB76|nr:glycoside hydrolase family 2 protein [Jannaschia marina]
MIDLTGDWTLRDAAGEHSCTLTLPGDAHTALAAAGLIPEPYVGRNEYECRWVAERDWIVSRGFEVDDTARDLVVEGLDCVASIAINGTVVLRAANAFRHHRTDVSGALQQGRNEIEIRFRSPVAVAAEIQARQPYPVPWHPGNCPIPNGNLLRKPQCDFGWDWNIALAPFGLRDAIRLEPRRPGRIEDIIVEQRLVGGAMQVSVVIHGGTEGAEATAMLCGVRGRATVQGGRARLTLRIEGPDLWWPAGQGAQPLHDLHVSCGAETATRRIGLREARLISEPDARGRSFTVRINGRDVFCKGAAWIPVDALPGRVDPERGRDLLRSAAVAHMNMVRVWGGGRYEQPWFYEECDRLGLMVWQDFMWACHLYPCDEDWLAEARDEAEEVARRLSHHPSIVLWCGDNELVGALQWFEESRRDRDRYLVGYDRLNRAVEAGFRAALPDAPWWPSSPSKGPMAFGDAFHEDGSGDMHFWAVWHEGQDFDHYRTIRPRFVSEFGFQSYPPPSVVARFAEPVDRNLASPVMQSHQKDRGGNARIAETIARYFRFPERFDDFAWLSQVQQGLALQTAIDTWRAQAPECMGTLIWQLNDTWPCVSWSTLSYGGEWKASHYMVAATFADVRVVVVPEDDTLRLLAVSDRPDRVDLRIVADAVGLDGSVRRLARSTACLSAGAQEVKRLDAGALGPDEMLRLTWTGGGCGDDLFAPRRWRDYALPEARPRLAATRDGKGWQLDISTDLPAYFVTIEADRPGRFDDNVRHVLPDRPVRLRFDPSDNGPTPRFTLRDLRSATYGRDVGDMRSDSDVRATGSPDNADPQAIDRPKAV